jgi:hypothetical protein
MGSGEVQLSKAIAPYAMTNPYIAVRRSLPTNGC